MFVDKLKAAGGDAEMMYLPARGIKGNSHMLMQDRNNLQLADLILTWIDGQTFTDRGQMHPYVGDLQARLTFRNEQVAAVMRAPSECEARSTSAGDRRSMCRSP